MGSTIPLVPRMEMPPSIPSCGLKVFFASVLLPSGTQIGHLHAAVPVDARGTRAAAWVSIILRGTRLMAAAPTG